MLRWAVDGPVYLPFCGDADIAVGFNRSDDVLAHERYRFPGLYNDRVIYAADLDKDRVKVAAERINRGVVIAANCDEWPFADVKTGPIAIADFDAWAEPWACWRSFWEEAEKADRLVVFFTDAHKMGVMVEGVFIRPDGSKKTIENLTERRQVFNFYLSRYIWPWFDEYIKPYRVIDRMRYSRGMLTYWGAALERNGARRRQ